MKKTILFLILSCPLLAKAQLTNCSGLIAPSGVCVPTATVATRPTAVTGELIYITDGNSVTDCTTGGGSTKVLCLYSGAAWIASASGGGGITGTFTTGSVPFATAATTLGEYPTGLFWDATNHWLGVGTNVPQTSLDVSGSAATVVKIRKSSSGDLLRINPNAAGSGVGMDAVNNAENTYEPLILSGAPVWVYASLFGVGSNSNSDFQVNTNGQISEYNRVVTAGVGIASILYSADNTGQTMAINDTTMVTVGGTSSVYRFSGEINCTGASASATATLNLKWTDTSNTAHTSSAVATCTTLGASSFGSITTTIRAKNATTVTYGVTIANSPTFDVSPRLEAM